MLMKQLEVDVHLFTIMEDNQSCIAIALHPVQHQRTKHISYHMVRDYIKQGAFKLIYVRTRDMIADVLTKPTSSTIFKHLRTLLCVKSIESIDRGSVGIKG
jgi:hypothetical protein